MSIVSEKRYEVGKKELKKVLLRFL